MPHINIRRVYEPERPDDGYRVLVDKLWPRGIKKENLHYDLWAKDIAPSASLRTWYHHSPEGRWHEFEQRYTHELENSQAVAGFIREIKRKPIVTLLYASKSATENHALVLRDFIEKTLERN